VGAHGLFNREAFPQLEGERTIHDPIFQQYWKPISALGAAMENADDHFAAIDTPPGTNVTSIYHLLQEGEDANIWTFEEGNYIGN
jgi:hypothetical protein